MSQDVTLDRVSMRFGAFTAVREVSLRIEPGEFFSFLGPSGCGKTTILRMVSGFIDPTEGAVRIGGKDMRGIRPNQRPTALIFQNLALFPLMPVWENIAFGLEVRGVGKAERRERAEELLRLVDLPGCRRQDGGPALRRAEAARGDRPGAGGRAQGDAARRAAVARSTSKLRQHMRSELRSIQKRTNVTFIYITHDQGEALAMSDRVGIMSQGVLQQVGAPQEIYNHPANGFVAVLRRREQRFPGRVIAATNGIGGSRPPSALLRARLGPGICARAMAKLYVRPEHSSAGRCRRCRTPAGRGHRGRVRGQLRQRPCPRRQSAAATWPSSATMPPRRRCRRQASATSCTLELRRRADGVVLADEAGRRALRRRPMGELTPPLRDPLTWADGLGLDRLLADRPGRPALFPDVRVLAPALPAVDKIGGPEDVYTAEELYHPVQQHGPFRHLPAHDRGQRLRHRALPGPVLPDGVLPGQGRPAARAPLPCSCCC